MALKTLPFDAANCLKTDEAIAAFVDEVLRSDDASYIAHALGVAARAKGITKLAEEAGLLRKDSRGALKSNDRVKLAAVLRVVHALGLRLAARRLAKPKRPKGKNVAK